MKEARNKEAIKDHHTNHYEHDDLVSLIDTRLIEIIIIDL